MPIVTRQKTMAVPMGALYRAITDFAAYPEFLPEVVSARVQEGASATRAQVHFEIEVVKRFKYTLQFEMSPTKVAWTCLESNFFKTNSGAWKLKETAQGTEVDYELEVEIGFFVPKFVAKKLTEVSLPKMFEAFEMRAQELA